MRITVKRLKSMIQEEISNAQEGRGYDGEPEPDHLKKARMGGRHAAKQKFLGKETDVKALSQSYIKLEMQAESETDEIKNTYIWGALEMIGQMLKKAGAPLPKKNRDAWAR